MNQTQSKAKTYLLLYAALILYSFISVVSKLTGRFEVLSPGFVGLYTAVVALLGLYALLWQQVLKRLPLLTAYVNKAVTIVLGMVWGLLFFGEPIKWNMLLGTAIIVAGVVLMGKADE
ncbi:EamA family transporter [Ruminococcaceae bacterium OttesenSCG-928-O06]|nr:EamA family transporter [Ruminococcaceae bacterium OttesenSCG-928-O06]